MQRRTLTPLWHQALVWLALPQCSRMLQVPQDIDMAGDTAHGLHVASQADGALHPGPCTGPARAAVGPAADLTVQ